jgi:hypothetical protein
MSGLEDRLRDARDGLGDPDPAATERAHDATRNGRRRAS